jgi:hypothetical protein
MKTWIDPTPNCQRPSVLHQDGHDGSGLRIFLQVQICHRGLWFLCCRAGHWAARCDFICVFTPTVKLRFLYPWLRLLLLKLGT